MFVTTKYEIPLSDFDYIKAGTELEVIENWNEYEGFIAVKYGSKELYFNESYFEVSVLVTN